MRELREDVKYIIEKSIEAVQPESSVKKAIEKAGLTGPIFLLAIGKAAWRMAKAAKEKLGDEIERGVVITRYGYSQGEIEGIEIFEAGHPILDRKTVEATDHALKLIESGKPDKILFLISGGGSALFEKPADGVAFEDLVEVNNKLFRSGASIVEINTVRKRLSSVKGGRFARLVAPSHIYTLVLSDVLGDRLDSIASGPTYPDSSTSEEALAVIEKYALNLRPEVVEALK
ncbi:MAG TPA: glycerate kinase, partial [Mesotoga sp.]|nr:glycerate kinase [Mesotoga sp.]